MSSRAERALRRVRVPDIISPTQEGKTTTSKRRRTTPATFEASTAPPDALTTLLAPYAGGSRIGISAFSLHDAVRHVAKADGGRLSAAVEKFGVPGFYADERQPDCFTALCRIVVGTYPPCPALIHVTLIPLEPNKV
jgi:hypothetical protein